MDFPHATEVVCIAMSIQGSLSVRNGPNKQNTMNGFHAFVKSVLTAYAGATFTNIFMGRPTSMLSNDIFFGSCILGYGIVNWLPYDMGYYICNTFIGTLIVNVLSQVFRVSGIYGFSDAAYHAFKGMPSPYYPTPVFGPILFPTMLGNMGGFLWAGFDGYLDQGMPWLFQQGVVCSTFYHFYAHDVEGSIGIYLRNIIKPFASMILSHSMIDNSDEKVAKLVDEDVLFARFVVGVFMVIMSVLHMPQLLGPKFSPFHTLYTTAVSGGVFQKKKRKGMSPVRSTSNGHGSSNGVGSSVNRKSVTPKKKKQ